MIEIDGEQIAIRHAEPSDHSFIIATWLNSFRSLYRINGLDKETYYKEHQKLIKAQLHHAHVACTDRSRDTILGWVCGQDGLLHYAYVIPELSLTPLARELVSAVCGTGIVDVTHPVVQACPVARYIYNPYKFGVIL